jgi:hypothetical protein
LWGESRNEKLEPSLATKRLHGLEKIRKEIIGAIEDKTETKKNA